MRKPLFGYVTITGKLTHALWRRHIRDERTGRRWRVLLPDHLHHGLPPGMRLRVVGTRLMLTGLIAVTVEEME